MFTIDTTLPFHVVVDPELSEEGDDFTLEIRFKRPTTKQERETIELAIGQWNDMMVDGNHIDYMETEPQWSRSGLTARSYVDTGGNNPALSPHLSDLFRQINDIVSIKWGKILCG